MIREIMTIIKRELKRREIKLLKKLGHMDFEGSFFFKGSPHLNWFARRYFYLRTPGDE